jgi:predicted RNA-binding protein (virulence factor B family)
MSELENPDQPFQETPNRADISKIQMGKWNTFTLSRLHPIGAFLYGGEFGEVLMPSRYVPPGICEGDNVEAFLFMDSEERPIATTDKPYAQVGDFAWLKVVESNHIGTFLDWGLTKDLLVPFSEQKHKMKVGQRYLVHLFLDDVNRIAASTKVDSYLESENHQTFTPGQEVQLLISEVTDMGYKAIVNQSHLGVLYANETFEKMTPGKQVKGYIKKIREDDKIDLSLRPQGYHAEHMDELGTLIVNTLQKNGGHLPLHDKSAPEAIYKTFKISKKAFKQAIGKLYKAKVIAISQDGIEIIQE